MRSIILHLLLVLTIGSVHVLGAYATVHVRHTHEMSEGHDHSHHPCDDGDEHHDEHGHSHEPCNDHPDPCDLPDSDSKCPSHEHCHVKILGGDSPLLFSDLTKAGSLHMTSTRVTILARSICPDGPYFGLIKPPQLG